MEHDITVSTSTAAPSNTGLPQITGTAAVGQTLATSNGTWTNSPTSYQYAWQDCDSSGINCTGISGATSSTYTVTTGDEGHTIQSVVTAGNAGGTSMSFSQVTATVPTPPPAAPSNSTAPAISGQAVQGQTLTASNGSWSGSPTSYAYQWQDCSSGCSNITGATGSTYTVQGSDVGDTIDVVVMATNAGGSGSATSTRTATVVSAAPSNTSLPTISGTSQQGQTLTASSGSWSGSPTSYAYQWQDCTSATSCSDISGATSHSYTLQSSDVGKSIDVVVKASSAGGAGSATSAQTQTVSAPPPPSNTAPATITGSPQVGNTLTSSTGSWSSSPTSFAYQWEDCDGSGSGCSAIAGATSNAYTLVSGDVSHTIRVVVTANNSGGSAASSSAPTAVVSGSASSFSCPSGVRCFFIANSGNDSNSGTSEATPWAHAPGMRTFTGSYAHQAGDEFIFKGGDTWGNANFPLAVVGSGSSSHPDYYGVDQSWYSGGSWTQPKFDGQDAPIMGTDPNSSPSTAGTNDIFFDLRRHDYITVDNIEMTGFCAQSTAGECAAGNASGYSYSYGNCAHVEMAGQGTYDLHITLNHLYIHNFYVDYASGFTGTCNTIQGYGNAAPYTGASVLENSTVTDDNAAFGQVIWAFGNVINNRFDGVNPGIESGGGTIAYNRFSNCGYSHFANEGGYAPGGSSPHIHANAIETESNESDTAPKTYYIHDNVIYNLGQQSTGSASGSAGECEAMFVGNAGETDYVWNNVWWNLQGNAPQLDARYQNGAGGFYFWNNTLEGAGSANGFCGRNGYQATSAPIAVIDVENNLCISTLNSSDTNGMITSGANALTAGNLTVAHNVKLTPSQASTDGYASTTATFPYLPPTGSSPTNGAATNLTPNCTTAITLCSDTTFAGGRASIARPTSSAWTVGAYEAP